MEGRKFPSTKSYEARAVLPIPGMVQLGLSVSSNENKFFNGSFTVGGKACKPEYHFIRHFMRVRKRGLIYFPASRMELQLAVT